MKKIIAIIVLLFFGFAAFAQEYRTHKVKKEETIESIAKQYKVTPFDLYALNPDAKKGLKPDTVLIIPKIGKIDVDVEPEETKELIGFKKHRVSRKETLYSLSKEYNVTIDEIKKHNKRLYSENLRKGDKIEIPRYKTVESVVSLENTIKKYKVQPKEGKWRVAYKFGITVPELEALNPNMDAVLQPGQQLNVPNIEPSKEKLVEESFNYYTVLKSEGYMALNRKLGVTQEQLEALNPELKVDGLKLGMVLKIPGDARTALLVNDVPSTDLTKNLKNLKPKNIALMLPFKTNKIDVDSIEATKKAIRTDGFLSVSLDFHAGVLMALDSAKQLGISTNLKVFDTKNQSSEISKILRENDFTRYDAVIGPLLTENFDAVASALKTDSIPVLSPLTMPKNLYGNVFQTIPSNELLEQTIINYVKSDSLSRRMIIVSDSKNKAISDRLKTEFPEAKQVFSRKNKEGQEAYFIYQTDLLNAIGKGRNIVFLETKNEGFASNVISMINGMTTDNNEIILMTTNKNKAFEGKEISNYHLSNLKFHYPSPNRTTDVSTASNAFVRAYRRIYNVSPNKYAVRGFDLTFDLLLRLSYGENLYKSSPNTLETEYVENKFRYSKKPFGGYYNEAVYIVKYDNMTIIEAKL